MHRGGEAAVVGPVSHLLYVILFLFLSRVFVCVYVCSSWGPSDLCFCETCFFTFCVIAMDSFCCSGCKIWCTVEVKTRSLAPFRTCSMCRVSDVSRTSSAPLSLIAFLRSVAVSKVSMPLLSSTLLRSLEFPSLLLRLNLLILCADFVGDASKSDLP